MKRNPHSKTLALALGSALILPASATLYWDINGTTAGSGNLGGIWNTTDPAYWTADADGLADNSATVFTNGEDVVFSAGTDGTGGWTVLISGTVETPSITFEEGGSQTISAGTIDLGPSAGLTIDTSAAGNGGGNTKTIASKITGTGGLTLALNGDMSNSGGGSDTRFTLSSTTSDFTGDLTVTSGLLYWTNDAALGNTANKIILDGGGVLFPNATNSTARNIQVGAGGGTIRVYGGTTTTLSGAISGTGTINFTDANGATLVLNGNGSAYSGTFNARRGLTNFDSANWAGMDLVVSEGDGSGANPNVRFRSGTTSTINSLTTGRDVHIETGTTLNVDTGVVNLLTDRGFWIQNAGAMTSSSGTLTINSGGPASGNLGESDQSIRVDIVDFGATPVALVKNNVNQLTLDQPNTYTGGTTINAGRINADNLSVFGTGTVTVNSGGQAYLTQIGTYANDFVINGPGTTEGAGTLGAIRFNGRNTISGDVTVASSARIAGYGDAAGTISGSLLGSGDLEINEAGNANTNGFITITGDASGYLGTMTVSRGNLTVGALGGGLTVNGGTANISGAVPGATAISGGTLNLLSGASITAPTVTGGTLTVGTGATVTGSITTALLTPATVNVGGTVTGSVTIDDQSDLGLRGGSIGGNLSVGFDALSANDLTYTGTLAVTGTATVHGTQTVYMNALPAPATAATLMTYTSISDPDDTNVLNNFVLNGAANWRNVTFANTGTALTVSLGTEVHKWVGNGPTNPTFFDTTSLNWSSSDSKFFNGDAITFDNSAFDNDGTPGDGNLNVNFQGLYAPYSVTFNNDSTHNYFLNGTGGHGFTGSMSLTKNGTGTVTMSGYSSNYTGPVAINAGILRAACYETLGNSSGITIASGAQLDIGGMQLGVGGSGRNYSFTIEGQGPDGAGGTGAIGNTGGDVYANAGILNLTLAADAEIGGNNGRFDVGRSEGSYIYGAIDGNNFTLTKVGTNQMVFRAPATDITYVVNGGRLTFEDYDSASGTNAITVNNTGFLGTYGNRVIANDVTFNAGSGLIGVGGGIGRWTGTHTIAGNMNYQVDDQLVIDGTLTGTGNITRNGGSLLVMQNDGAGYSGRFTNNGGTLRLESTAALGTYTGSDWLTIQGALQAGTVTSGAITGTIGSATQGIVQTNSVIYDPGEGNTLTINSPITGSAGWIDKTWSYSGHLVFNEDININGGVNSHGGTLTFNGDLALTNELQAHDGIVVNINSPSFTSTNGLRGLTGTTNINIGTGAINDIELGNNTNLSHTVNHLAGDLRVSNDFRVGHYPGETSYYNISAGTVSQPDTVTNVNDEGQANLFLGIDGTGVLNISGTGTVNTTSLRLDGRGDTGGTDTLNLTGGTLNIGKHGIQAPNASYSIQLGGGTIGTTSSSTTPGYDWSSSWSSSAAMTLTGTNGDTTFNPTAGREITLTGSLSGSGGLIKAGAGSLNLNGSNSFLGSATVNGGTLAGTGTIVGPLTVNSSGAVGAGTSGAAGIAGTFNVGNSTVNGSVVLDLNAASTGTGNDLLNVAGDILFNAGSKIAPRFYGAATPGVLQTYTLITYSGTLTGTPTLDNTYYADYRPPTTNLSLGTGSNSNVTLDVTFNTASLFWSGTPANSNWDTNLSLNWDGAAPPADEKYFNGDSVTFDSLGNNTNPITITADVSPAALTVNSDNPYTFQGAAITGTTGLTKNGTGTLLLLNNNTYTGAVTIQNGTVQVGNGGTTGTLGGSGTVNLTGGTLEFNRSDNLTFSRVITGGGALVKNGSGTLEFPVNMGYTGGTTVNQGRLLLSEPNNNDVGNIQGTVTVNTGATLEITGPNALGWGGQRVTTLNLYGGTFHLNQGNNDSSYALAINMNGATISGTGNSYLLHAGGTSVNVTGDTTSTISSYIRLREPGNVPFNVDNGAAATDLLVSGEMYNGAGFAKNGAGTMTVTSTLANAGNITVNDGVLQVSQTGISVLGNNLYGTGGTIEHVSPAGLVLAGSGTNFAGTIDANGKPVFLNNATAGSGTGGTLATEGATVTNGLYQTEGLLFFADIDSGSINTTPLPNTSAVRSSAAALHGGIGETQTLAFDGEIYLPAGDWSFGENVDDNVYVNINGTTILNDGNWNTPTSGTFNSAGGWYPVTLRVWNGGGGAGPVDAWYTAGIGIGIKTGGASTNVADYVRFEIGALGTKCRVTGPALNVAMAGGLTTGGGTTTTVDTREATITVGGPVNGPDPLAKTGTGTLTLNGSGSLTGAVTVQQGTLVLGPGASIGSAASVTVNSGATLAGTGTSAATTVNGTLSPGSSGIGALSTSGNLVFGPSSVFIAEGNSDTPAADKVNVTGNVTIDPSTSAIFSDLGSTVLAGPLKIVVIEYTGTLSGTFAGRAEGSNVVIGGNTFVLRYADTVGPNKGVTLSIGGDYDDWAAFYSLTGPNALPTADPDGDGATNEEEYAFGLVPTSGASVSPITLGLSKTAGTFTYTRRDDALTGLIYKVWTSPDLATWTEDTTATESVTAAGQNEIVEVTVSGTKPLTAPKLFVRVSYQ